MAKKWHEVRSHLPIEKYLAIEILGMVHTGNGHQHSVVIPPMQCREMVISMKWVYDNLISSLEIADDKYKLIKKRVE